MDYSFFTKNKSTKNELQFQQKKNAVLRSSSCFNWIECHIEKYLLCSKVGWKFFLWLVYNSRFDFSLFLLNNLRNKKKIELLYCLTHRKLKKSPQNAITVTKKISKLIMNMFSKWFSFQLKNIRPNKQKLFWKFISFYANSVKSTMCVRYTVKKTETWNVIMRVIKVQLCVNNNFLWAAVSWVDEWLDIDMYRYR